MTNRKEYFKQLRDQWNEAKEHANVNEIQAIIENHGLKISVTGYYFVKQQMDHAGLDGTPYLDAKTFKGWKDNDYTVKKGGKMKTLELKFVGIDSWNRPIFKDVNNKRDYYGATDILFDYGSTAECVLNKITPEEITYFGSLFDCEPMGTSVSDEIKFINPNN